MRSLLALLPASLLLSTPALASEQTLQTASTSGHRRAYASLEVGAGRYQSSTLMKLAAADVAASYGVSADTDVTVRFGLVSGYEFGMKRELRFAALPKFVFAADGRAGLRPSAAGSLPFLNANAGLIAQWSPWHALHLIASPRLILSSTAAVAPWKMPSQEDGRSVGLSFSESAHYAVVPAATVGLAVDVQPSFRIIGEAGFVFAPVAQTYASRGLPPLRTFEALRGVTGAIALQWRPEDFVGR